MLHYTEKEIKDMARSIVGEISFIKAVGNHELGRHLVYHVKAKSGPSIILKLYYKKDRRSREIASLRLLSGSGVKCPSLLDYGILDDGTEWATTEYLEGEVFVKVKKNISHYDSLQLFTDMGIELGKIHSYRTFDFFGEWDENGNSIGNVNQYMVFFQSYAESCAAEIHMQQLPERNLLDRAILFLRDNYSVMKGIKESRLCHNDFNGRNVIVEESLEGWKVKGIIDFEQCVPGNREIDIAMLYHTYFLNDSSLERAFLKGYSRYLNIEREFYSRLNYYLLYIGVYICSWAYARAPEYYMEGIELIKSLQDILHF